MWVRENKIMIMKETVMLACMFQCLYQYYFQSWCLLRHKTRDTKIVIMKETLMLACMFQCMHQHYSQSWCWLICKRKNGIKSLKNVLGHKLKHKVLVMTGLFNLDSRHNWNFA